MQLIFNSDEVLVRNGTVGIEQEYSYAITDAGADIYYSWGEKFLTLTYDPSADTLTMIDEADNFAVFKRGEYPQPEAGLDYIADWIYGTMGSYQHRRTGILGRRRSEARDDLHGERR